MIVIWNDDRLECTTYLLQSLLDDKMSFDTSWDVEKYRLEFESEELWNLKRDFMVTYKDKFSEERLVCLAQVFINVEFLGCRYPEDTMKLVEELSKEVAADHRDRQKTKLQRTFASASDAAGAKYKGADTSRPSLAKEDNGNRNMLLSSQEDAMDSQPSSKYTKIKKCSNGWVKDTLGNIYQTSQSLILSDSKEFCSSNNLCRNSNNDTSYHDLDTTGHYLNSVGQKGRNGAHTRKGVITIDEIKRTSGPCGCIVLFVRNGEDPYSSLVRTASQWQKNLKCVVVKEGEEWSASVALENFLLGSYKDKNKLVAKRTAGRTALDKLMEWYFTVKIKCAFSGGGEVVKTTGKEKVGVSQPDNVEYDFGSPLDEDNVGLKLLKMMGWSGGGLGKNLQGIVEPIKPINIGNSRLGLGSTPADIAIASKKKNKKNNSRLSVDGSINQDLLSIKKIVRDYQRSNNLNDLVFSSEFSKEQRAALHLYAMRLGLKSKSYGGKSETKRHLVISKKIDSWMIIKGLVENVEQFSIKYELLRPRNHFD